MNTNQNSYLDTTELYNHSPDEFLAYVDTITKAVDWAHKHKGAPNDCALGELGDIIIVSWFISENGSWIKCFTDAQRIAAKFYRDQNTYWKTIVLGLSTPAVEKACLEMFPDLDREEYFPFTHPTRARTTIVPEVSPKTKPSTTRSPRQTILQSVKKRSPSIRYLRVFEFLSSHTKNKTSSRGREVYPYGQHYAARTLGISLRSTERIFHWLRRRGIIFKRSNENWDHHRCATWFVCTSWKQSTYFRDPEDRRPKKGSPRSSRKRHSPKVNT